MRDRIYVCECVESGSHVPAPHIHVDQLPKPVEAVLTESEPRPGMFRSPGQAAGYLFAWLVMALIFSGLLVAIALVWRWLLDILGAP